MRTRSVTLPTGQTFTVPQNIQRIDARSTHGWQVRYQGTKFFSDGSADGTGADVSLRTATKELMRRIATMAAPVPLRDSAPLANKKSGLPPGISGPIVRTREGEAQRTAVLSVLLPRFGDTPQVKTIYIGTENTYTQRRFRTALAKAVQMRAESVERYRKEATRARRKAAKATMASMAAQG